MSNGHVKTWDVIDWPDEPAEKRDYELACNHCGNDAHIEIGPTPGGLIIAAIGLSLIFDPPGYKPPDNFMPKTIRCRHCRRVWTKGAEDINVR
jgi:hypothetical protein